MNKNEIENIDGGIIINILGLYIIEGVLDGVKKTPDHWSWEK